ncbi:MAG: copper resistance protein B [Rhizomicrobium sp.]
MRRQFFAFAAAAFFPLAAGAEPSAAPYGAPVHDDHVYYHVLLDQFEGRFGTQSSFRWSGEAWAGTDMNRLRLKSEGEVGPDGRIEDGRHEILYSRPISRYFDLQGGVRLDADSGPGRTWLAFGVEGLAPLFFHVSATAYVGDRGRYAARLEGNYDLLLTQRLILQPQWEANFYSSADPLRLTGSGLSDLDAGLRLRYEIDRKFAPYLAVTYENSFGGTAVLRRGAGETGSALRVGIGLRAWL